MNWSTSWNQYEDPSRQQMPMAQYVPPQQRGSGLGDLSTMELWKLRNSQAPSPTSVNVDGKGGPDIPGLNKMPGMHFYNKDEGLLRNFFGSTNEAGDMFSGYGQTAVGMASGLANTYLGYQNMKTTKEALAHEKDAFSKQFGAQQKSYNNELSNRYIASRTKEQYNDTDYNAYMKKHGI